MKNKKQNLNAIVTLTNISRILQESGMEFIRQYSDDLKNLSEPAKKKQTKISDEARQQFADNVEKLSAFMHLTPLETLLFVAIYSVQSIRDCNVDCRDMASYFGINNLDFLPLKIHVSSLLKKGVLREVTRRREREYLLSCDAERALLENKPFKKKKAVEMDQYKFCNAISDLIEERSNDGFDTIDLFNFVLAEEDEQKNLSIVKNAKKLIPDIEDRTLFYEVCDDFVSDRYHRNTDLEHTLGDIYDTMRSKLGAAKSIMSKESALITSELVELLPAKFLAEAELTLAEKGKKMLLEEDYDLFCLKGGNDRRLLSPDKIPARELFFNDELTRDINFVKQSLQEESFVALQKRLESSSLPKGVAILLHGLPGTGKTAVAEMLAKETGRSVYHVDIAASKTCWFGESEKLFKKIFTDYRQMCESQERKPILLFNEADALFSKRRDVDSGNCAQTENALQNILLEEMEKLDGILVATTNLCNNFDDAFERRFLFKINFGKPSTEAKKAIWKSKMSWLTDDDCAQLATRYDLSGGEIDNIVRKALMEEVINGKRPTLTELESWCRGEKLSNGKCAAIGFAH
ncbi:MAG: ATP-binding protein [Bacteroidales bacterium]|nr:ATP-binding protein [Bacteroidales bacterium]